MSKKTVAKKTVITQPSQPIKINNYDVTEEELDEFCKFVKKPCQNDDCDDCEDCEHHYVIRTFIDIFEIRFSFIYNDEIQEMLIIIHLLSGINYVVKYINEILLNSITIDCEDNDDNLKEFFRNFHYICSSDYVEIVPYNWSMMAKENLPKIKCFDKLHKQITVEKMNKIARKLTKKSFTCSVCSEEISEKQKTKCNHGLCFYCYYKLENKTCPICRNNISSVQTYY